MSYCLPVCTNQELDNYFAGAAKIGDVEILQAFLDNGADMCLRDKRDHTAMIAAIANAEWSIARLLYNETCHENSQTTKSRSNLLLCRADRQAKRAQTTGKGPSVTSLTTIIFW
ncbi:MAG: ankyrin repeat domain-containing protein [Gammaproteobacteria bacterium]|nr:ankyrin repeat domain-containing protein [Gammaproteobacteria bacterium]